MSRKRITVLTVLALLTVLFLSAALATFLDISFAQEVFPDTTLPVSSSRALRLTVYDTGIAAIPLSQLRKEGLLTTRPPSQQSLSLTRNGEAVPFYIVGEGDEATLYFFAQAITRSVEAPAVYWLMPGEGLTMPRRTQSPSQPGKAIGWREWQWEENRNFHPMATGEDPWFGHNLFAPGNLVMPLAGLRPTGGPGLLTVRIWSSNKWPANPDHHMEIWLNGSQLADHFWDGISEETLAIPLERGTLQPENNTLLLNVPGDTGVAGESIFLDWIRLQYEGELTLTGEQLMFRSDADNIRINEAGSETLVFDVSNPHEPVLLVDLNVEDNALHLAGGDSEKTYLALNPDQALRPLVGQAPTWQSPLRTEGRGADYIAIVPGVEGFEAALEPLLKLRESQGLRVAAVPLQQIYDEFGHGRPTPQAIRDFLTYTRTDWEPPAPRFVLLAGDASYDIRNYMGKENRNLVPTYLIYTEFAGYVASDTWFTITNEDMPFPEVAIGRLPAQTVEQLQLMVGKVISYEEATDAGWNARALLVADDEPAFNTASNWLAEILSQNGYHIQKLYMTQNEEIHDAIISAVNHGVGVVNYAGHGSIAAWGDEMVLHADDAQLLLNGDYLPIFTTFTCLNGLFNHPEETALAESLLWAKNGGVVAAIAPSGRTHPSQQTPLANSFYEALLTGEITTLGEALLQAKVVAARDPNMREAAHTFNLLGDPALRFRMPVTEKY